MKHSDTQERDTLRFMLSLNGKGKSKQPNSIILDRCKKDHYACGKLKRRELKLVQACFYETRCVDQQSSQAAAFSKDTIMELVYVSLSVK